jgi:hypothetical protein
MDIENGWMRLRTALLAPLVVALISCGGGDDPEEIEGLISIDRPTGSPTYETYAQSVHASGSRSTSVTSVAWTNAAGGNGAANLTLQRNCVAFPIPIVFPECNHAWDATIPLIIGANVITVTGYDSDGDFGRDTITITRRACPPPPPATPFAEWPLACR